MQEQELLERARRGSEDAYRRLVEPFRRELHAHCYRMLGSLHDAEDALQDAMLRAWRGLPRFEGRSSVRSWLYRIATNASLDVIGRRPKRVLPMDYGPATDPAQEPGQPVAESVWVEPYPEEVADGRAAPDARYEQRESVELAFVAAMQHLPARQRAVLIMREVLGFSAAEVSESLDTTVASVNSALQRARHAVDERLPERSQQATLRALGDEAIEDVVERYMQAWERNDVDAVVELLAEDATIAMPPLASWYGGRANVARFLANWPMSGEWRWRVIRTRANAQPALAYYVWDEEEGAYLPFALNVLAFAGDRIKDITAFVVRSVELERFDRWPEAPQATAIFERFGLPEKLR